jgi:hypothetical protein
MKKAEEVVPWWRTYMNPDDPARWQGTTSQMTWSEVRIKAERPSSSVVRDDFLNRLEAECRKFLKGMPPLERDHLSRAWYTDETCSSSTASACASPGMTPPERQRQGSDSVST